MISAITNGELGSSVRTKLNSVITGINSLETTAGAIGFATGATTLAFAPTKLFWDNSNNRLGLLTNAPTHTLTLGSAGQIALYGTTDQVTNYERVIMAWSLDTFLMEVFAAGSAGPPDFLLGVVRADGKEARMQLLPSPDGPHFRFLTTAANTTGTNWMEIIPLLGASTGITQVGVSIAPTITQSGTAAYTALLVSVTQTSTGSGAKLLIDLQVAGASKFKVDNAGAGTFAGGVNATTGVFSSSISGTTGTFTGVVSGLSYITTQTTLTYASTTNLDFDAAGDQLVTLTGNVTFTTSHRAAGKNLVVRITADSSARNFTFPSWVPIGAALPASIAANKNAILSLRCYGSNDTDIVAAYSAQP